MNDEGVIASADNQRLAARGRSLVYAIAFGNIILALLYYRGLVHPVVAGVLYWAAALRSWSPSDVSRRRRIQPSEGGGHGSHCSSAGSAS